MALFTKSNLGLVAIEELFLDRSQKLILKSGDPRAAFLLARKGGIVPERAVKALGLNEKTALADVIEKPKAISSDAIEHRSTRPEKISKTQ